jgi:hypothetical protein
VFEERRVWRTRYEELETGRGTRCVLELDARPASFAQALDGWVADEEFRSLFNDVLAGSRFTAFRWETPPVSAATVTRQFEFVLMDSPALTRPADPRAFAAHFAGAGDAAVVVFPNVGRDAVMVAPCPIAAPSVYGHLAAFVRGAPAAQRQALWHAVGKAMAARIGSKPVWLSTAGAGVAWLHVRLDDRPKYYAYDPYRDAP